MGQQESSEMCMKLLIAKLINYLEIYILDQFRIGIFKSLSKPKNIV